MKHLASPVQATWDKASWLTPRGLSAFGCSPDGAQRNPGAAAEVNDDPGLASGLRLTQEAAGSAKAGAGRVGCANQGGAPELAGFVARARSALRGLTVAACLSAVNAVNEASFGDGPRNSPAEGSPCPVRGEDRAVRRTPPSSHPPSLAPTRAGETTPERPTTAGCTPRHPGRTSSPCGPRSSAAPRSCPGRPAPRRSACTRTARCG